MDVKIENSWKRHLTPEFEKLYFKELTSFVKQEYLSHAVYPEPRNLFRAFDLCPFENVKVVILGQDPYHGAGQAIGMSFAVNENVTVPPSLQNIFKEIQSDLNTPLVHTSGDLSRWAQQGVLLLNASLTVRAQQPASHQNMGWELFTDAVITALSQKREHIVFMLWGNSARKKGMHIDTSKHLVLTSSHPSPFSAHAGFLGCKHFSKANAYLEAHGISKIDWL